MASLNEDLDCRHGSFTVLCEETAFVMTVNASPRANIQNGFFSQHYFSKVILGLAPAKTIVIG